ncbi:thioredoxin family protein [Robertkochia aurantiaca]|uniref:thioredoxin family protein n=1 Tax=Robertkochia aurantiaca TaxID=2873700 RepID=UPI001CCC6C55|nr:DUF255 domain-containing protein [Robertkochia sp. 3YJGBD-33]
MKYALITFLTMLTAVTAHSQEIKWMSWDEAVAASESSENPKKIFIDVYTDWCGWCKRMDKDTFNDPEVAAYMKEHFYMVKFDAEGKEDVTYKGRTYSYVPQGRRGYHELAAALLQGQLSYPTVVFLNENQEMLSPVPGYMKPKQFIPIARYFGEDIYKTTKWDEYQASLDQ